MEKNKQPNEKNFIVFYSGNAGRKADSLKSAIAIAKEYIKEKKIKTAEIYELVKSVK